MTTRIDRLDVAELDLGLSGQLAVIDNAALDGVPLRHHTAETFRLDCHDRGGEGPDEGLWVARDDEGVVGYAVLTLDHYGDPDGAKILGAVHPAHQRRGVGRALLQRAEAATDRTHLRAPAWAGTAGEQAMPALGYRRAGSHVVRRLALHRPQPTALRQRAEAASQDYDLASFRGACPEELLADMQVLREAINDAPGSDTWEAYPPERIRRYERSLDDQRQTPYTVVARHRATGEPAGLTMVCVHELRPAIAAQEDTSVLASHRGHRLALRLKLAMLDRLAVERPDVTSVDTWNVPGNAPMIAINDALGCRPVAETVSFRKQR